MRLAGFHQFGTHLEPRHNGCRNHRMLLDQIVYYLEFIAVKTVSEYCTWYSQTPLSCTSLVCIKNQLFS